MRVYERARATVTSRTCPLMPRLARGAGLPAQLAGPAGLRHGNRRLLVIAAHRVSGTHVTMRDTHIGHIDCIWSTEAEAREHARTRARSRTCCGRQSPSSPSASWAPGDRSCGTYTASLTRTAAPSQPTRGYTTSTTPCTSTDPLLCRADRMYSLTRIFAVANTCSHGRTPHRTGRPGPLAAGEPAGRAAPLGRGPRPARRGAPAADDQAPADPRARRRRHLPAHRPAPHLRAPARSPAGPGGRARPARRYRGPGRRPARDLRPLRAQPPRGAARRGGAGVGRRPLVQVPPVADGDAPTWSGGT